MKVSQRRLLLDPPHLQEDASPGRKLSCLHYHCPFLHPPPRDDDDSNDYGDWMIEMMIYLVGGVDVGVVRVVGGRRFEWYHQIIASHHQVDQAQPLMLPSTNKKR